MQRRHAAPEAGIVAENIEAAEFLFRESDHVANVAFLGDIDIERNRSGSDAGGDFFLFAADIGTDDFRSFGAKELGHGLAHARTGACDDGDLVC
jgi:hypothetical protein